MKKRTINCSWPVILSDFSKDNSNQNENFSRGKLEVFYIGETADHRKFSKEFAENLVKSLPYTPIVSCYNEEEDDFEGHAAEQQIYGIVDPRVEPQFITKENGEVWCVCDVVYYTERPDKTGEIAAKIAGHAHSLELDPNSIEYVVNYDENKRFQNIEFTAGTFVGVSVLGSKQRPAFTGSAFFESNADFDEKMHLLKNYIEQKGETENTMDTQDFAELSFEEIQQRVATAIDSKYSDECCWAYIVECFNDSVVFEICNSIERTCNLYRVPFSFDASLNVILGEAVQVTRTYEPVSPAISEEPVISEATDMETVIAPSTDVEEKADGAKETYSNEDNADLDKDDKDAEEKEDEADEDEKEELADATSTNVESDPQVVETPEVVSVESTEPTPEISPVIPEEVREGQPENKENIEPAAPIIQSETAIVNSNEEPATGNPENYVEGEQHDDNTSSDNTSFAAPIDDQKKEEEVAQFSAAQKLLLVNEYKELLSPEQITDFANRIDEYADKQSLEIDLLKAYKAKTLAQPTMRIFSHINSSDNSTSGNSLDDTVRKYL